MPSEEKLGVDRLADLVDHGLQLDLGSRAGAQQAAKAMYSVSQRTWPEKIIGTRSCEARTHDKKG